MPNHKKAVSEDGCIRAIVFPVEKKYLGMGIAERMNG
jgi:hypothetical protein